MIGTARAANIAQLIFISTCSNYGVSKPGELADEDSPLNPLSDYARAKVECEKLILAAPPPPATTVLRFGTICGLSGRMRFDLLVSEMAKKCARGESIDIFSPEAWRPFLHVVDAARVIEHVLKSSPNQTARRVFNVVGENYQKQGLVDLARRYFPDVDIKVTNKISPTCATTGPTDRALHRSWDLHRCTASRTPFGRRPARCSPAYFAIRTGRGIRPYHLIRLHFALKANGRLPLLKA